MTEIKRIDELAKDLPDEIFANRLPTTALLAPFDHLLEVTLRTVLHDDEYFEIFLVNTPIVVPHNIGMVQVS